MWPFKKKNYPPLSEMPESSWVVCDAQDADGPVITRVNDWMRGWVGHPQYSTQVGGAVPFDPAAPRWTKPSTDELAGLENLLHERLCRDEEAVAVLVVTDPKVREYIFYTMNPASTKSRLLSVVQEVAHLPVQFILQRDPQWKVFRRLAPR